MVDHVLHHGVSPQVQASSFAHGQSRRWVGLVEPIRLKIDKQVVVIVQGIGIGRQPSIDGPSKGSLDSTSEIAPRKKRVLLS